MWLRFPAGGEAAPGQFLMLRPDSDSHLLPRPISVCEALKGEDQLRIVWRSVGFGTAAFSTLKSGDSLSLMGPLGNGFPLGQAQGNVLVLGGGIGIPPLLGLAKALHQDMEKQSRVRSLNFVLGYRSGKNGLFLSEEFSSLGNLFPATDDGSEGFHGTVTDCARSLSLSPDIIYACGPLPMLRAVKSLAREYGIPAFVSLEERMACGVGACLGCVVKTTQRDPHSQVNNSRICTEGPVFDSEKVLL